MINIENISKGFARVASIQEEINNMSKIEMLELSDISFSSYNPYNENDDEEIIKQLADNISAIGLLEPLVVNKKADGSHVLLSGERRYKALKKLDYKTAPCVVFNNLSNDVSQYILHSANLETREYTTAQKFKFYKDVVILLTKMKENGELKGGLQKNIAQMLKVSDRQVRKYQSISENLPQEAIKLVEENKLSINQAYEASKEIKKSPSENQTNNPDEDYYEAENTNNFTEIKTQPKESILPEIHSEEMINTNSSRPTEEKTLTERQSLKVSSDDVTWRKRLEQIIPEYYGKSKILKYYFMQVPTPAEAAKELLKPEYGYASYGTSQYSITLTSKGVEINFGNECKEFKYSFIDEIIRDMIRSNCLISNNKHQKILKEVTS